MAIIKKAKPQKKTKKPPLLVSSATIKDAFGRSIKVLSYANGRIRFKVKNGSPAAIREAFLTGRKRDAIICLEPDELPFKPEAVIESLKGKILEDAFNVRDGDECGLIEMVGNEGLHSSQIDGWKYSASKARITADLYLRITDINGPEVTRFVRLSAAISLDPQSGQWVLGEVKSVEDGQLDPDAD